MITRRRYSVPVRKTGQQTAPGFDVRVGRSSSDAESSLRSPVRVVDKENWWTDWRATTLVVALVLTIGVSLYFVKGKEMDYSAAPAPRPPSSASSPSSPQPPSSPRRYAAVQNQSSGGYSEGRAPAVGDANSFLAFSRTAKAGHEGAATASTPARNASSPMDASSPSGAPSVISHGDRKIVLPDRLSGECKVGGANIDDFLKGLGDCFSRRTGGGA